MCCDGPDRRADVDEVAFQGRGPVDTIRRVAWRWSSAVAVVAVALLTYGAQVRGSYFYADDFLYLQLARRGNLGWSWLSVSNYGHFAPLTRLAYLAVQRAVGMNYPVAALAAGALAATISAAFLSLGRITIGARLATVVVALLAALSILMLRVVMWWGAAIHVLGAAAAYLWAVVFFAKFVSTHRRRHQILSIIAFAVGLLIQERPLILVGYLILIRYLLRWGIAPATRVVAQIRRDWTLWAPYFVVVGIYLAYRLTYFVSDPQPGSLHDSLLFLVSGVQRSFLPAIAGLRTGPFSDWVPAASIIGAAALLIILIHLVAHRRGAWRVIAFVAITYLVNMGLLAVGRLAAADPIAQSRDLQYFYDAYLALLLGLVIGYGSLPVRASADRRVARAATIGITVVVAVAASSTGLSWVRMIEANPQTASREYFREGIAALAREGPSYDLMRLRTNTEAIPSFIAPYDDLPGVFGLDRRVHDSIDPLSADHIAVSPSGEVRKTVPITLRSVIATPETVAVQGGTVREQRANGLCIDSPAAGVLQVPITPQLIDTDLFYALSYSSTSPQEIRAVTAITGSIFYNWNTTDLPATDSGLRIDRLDGTQLESLWISLEDGVDNLCIRGIWVGQLGWIPPEGGCTRLTHYVLPVLTTSACDERWTSLFDAG